MPRWYLSREVCLLTHGEPASSNMQAAHSCRHRNCINSRHLSWKTPVQNQADRLRDGTDARGVKHWNVKLTPESVAEIRQLRPTHTLRQLSEQFGAHISHISSICNGKKWVGGEHQRRDA